MAAVPKRTPSGANPSQTDVRGYQGQSSQNQTGGKFRYRGSKRRGAVAVGDFVQKITQKAFEKFGFPTVALLTDWQTIAGAQLASYTRPEKLKWPRLNEAESDLENQTKPQSQMQRIGATLVLRVDGPRAIEIQHHGPQLLDRINAYFGYRAVSDLRFVQAPLDPDTPRSNRPKPRPLSKETPPDLSGIEDEALRAALEKLAAGVYGRPRKSER